MNFNCRLVKFKYKIWRVLFRKYVEHWYTFLLLTANIKKVSNPSPLAQSAGAKEYIDCISEEDKTTPQRMSCLWY